MKKYITIFLLLVLAFSCKEEELLNPCRYIEIELATINDTNTDLGFYMEIGWRSDCIPETYHNTD